MGHMSQWFGNIVTMDWWDDLWLNEGFASFFAFVGVDRAEPSWEMVSRVLGLACLGGGGGVTCGG